MCRASAVTCLLAALLTASGCTAVRSNRPLVTDANRVVPSLPDRFLIRTASDAFKDGRIIVSREGKSFIIEMTDKGKTMTSSVEFFSQRHTSDNRPAFLVRAAFAEPNKKPDLNCCYFAVEMYPPNQVVMVGGSPSADDWVKMQDNAEIKALVDGGDLAKAENGDIVARSVNAIYTLYYATPNAQEIEKRTLNIVPLPAKTR